MRTTSSAALRFTLVGVAVVAAFASVRFLASRDRVSSSDVDRAGSDASGASTEEATERTELTSPVSPTPTASTATSSVATQHADAAPTSIASNDERTLAWEREVAGLAPEELAQIAEDEAKAMNAVVIEELKRRSEAGAYEVVGHGPKHKATPEEQDEMNRVFTLWTTTAPPEREQRKTVLPEDDYAELYERKAHVAWLRDRAAKK